MTANKTPERMSISVANMQRAISDAECSITMDYGISTEDASIEEGFDPGIEALLGGMDVQTEDDCSCHDSDSMSTYKEAEVNGFITMIRNVPGLAQTLFILDEEKSEYVEIVSIKQGVIIVGEGSAEGVHVQANINRRGGGVLGAYFDFHCFDEDGEPIIEESDNNPQIPLKSNGYQMGRRAKVSTRGKTRRKAHQPKR